MGTTRQPWGPPVDQHGRSLPQGQPLQEAEAQLLRGAPECMCSQVRGLLVALEYKELEAETGVLSLAQGGVVVMSEVGCGPGVLRPLAHPLSHILADSTVRHLRLNVSSAQGPLPTQATAPMAPSPVPIRIRSNTRVQTIISSLNHGGCYSHSPQDRQLPVDPDRSHPRILP